MDDWLTRIGLVLCGLVIAGAVALGIARLVAGPRTLDHVPGPCTPPKAGTTCVHDHYTGNVVGRPWMIVAGTLAVCAGAIGATLRQHRRTARQLSGA